MNSTTDSRESTSLLQNYGSTWFALVRLRYKKSQKCLSSKGAIALLMWSFAVFSLYHFIWSPACYLIQHYIPNTTVAFMTGYGNGAIIFGFCPLAGYLADNKYGQYKTAIFSQWIFFLLSILFSIFVTLVITAHIYSDNVIILYIAIGLLVISVPLLFIGLGVFYVTILPLAMDQLYDFNTDKQSLFIHWFVWISSVSTFLIDLINFQIEYPYTIFNKILSNTSTTQNFGYREICGYACFCIILVVLHFVSLYITRYKKYWFWIEPSRINPYKLVYKVTKFSWQQKVPLNRSAFTYCEDDIPRGLNLAKNKYGGPFTTEQVEDVKVFFGIMKVLFIICLSYFLVIAEDSIIWLFYNHGLEFEIFHKDNLSFIDHKADPVTTFLIVNRLLVYIVTIICIPIYLFIIRPFFLNYIPGILKRMGIGVIMKVLSLMCTLIIGTWAHSRYDVGCLFNESSNVVTLNETSKQFYSGPFYDIRLLSIQCILQSLSYLLIEISIYEFICSQSPHSMKGLVMGVLFFMKGMYFTVNFLVSFPFAFLMDHSNVSCGVSYYAMNVGVGVVTVLAYIWVARKYKYRERDEVCNIYMYAENYYSKGPPEE